MSSRGKPSNQELRQRTHRFVTVVDASARVLQTLIKWGALTGIAFFSYKAVGSLSGKTTLASIVVSLLGDLRINQWIAYALAVGGCGWALGERNLRRKRVAELTGRTKELEMIVDKKRSSSSLPVSGKTRQDDKI
jgi:hypothetical protein